MEMEQVEDSNVPVPQYFPGSVLIHTNIQTINFGILIPISYRFMLYEQVGDKTLIPVIVI